MASIIGAITGIGTLSAAIWAAFWAKRAGTYTGRAAEEAKRSADAAERTLAVTQAATHAELRPWIAVSVRLTGFVLTERNLTVEYETVFTNTGRTAARDVSADTDCELLVDAGPDKMQQLYYGQRAELENDTTILLPGSKTSIFSRGHIPIFKAWPTDWPAVNIVIAGTARYAGQVDPEAAYITQEAFRLGAKRDDVFSRGRITRAMAGLNADDMLVERYIAGQVR